jgi:catechol 2,3-dioxygenase-like lactoylglutathione lyase family enzyme
MRPEISIFEGSRLALKLKRDYISERAVIIYLPKEEGSMLQNAPMYSYIPAKDVARARSFYEEKLGFRPKEVTAGGVTYEFANGTACFLYPTPNAGTSQASQAFWQVDDVEKEVTELMSRGVKFEKYDMPDIDEKGISTAGGAKAAWFKDTEGNILALIQTL